MRIVTSLCLVLSLSSLVGCATPGAAGVVPRGADTAVRAESRRISQGALPTYYEIEGRTLTSPRTNAF